MARDDNDDLYEGCSRRQKRSATGRGAFLFGGVHPPAMSDIVCTKDKSCHRHPGNMVFKQVILGYTATYNSAERTKIEKMEITKEIVRKLQEKHKARFVKLNERGHWEEIEEAHARGKVSHALKNAHKKSVNDKKSKTAGGVTTRKKQRRQSAKQETSCSACSNHPDMLPRPALRRQTSPSDRYAAMMLLPIESEEEEEENDDSFQTFAARAREKQTMVPTTCTSKRACCNGRPQLRRSDGDEEALALAAAAVPPPRSTMMRAMSRTMSDMLCAPLLFHETATATGRGDETTLKKQHYSSDNEMMMTAPEPLSLAKATSSGIFRAWVQGAAAASTRTEIGDLVDLLMVDTTTTPPVKRKRSIRLLSDEERRTSLETVDSEWCANQAASSAFDATDFCDFMEALESDFVTGTAI